MESSPDGVTSAYSFGGYSVCPFNAIAVPTTVKEQGVSPDCNGEEPESADAKKHLSPSTVGGVFSGHPVVSQATLVQNNQVQSHRIEPRHPIPLTMPRAAPEWHPRGPTWTRKRAAMSVR